MTNKYDVIVIGSFLVFVFIVCISVIIGTNIKDNNKYKYQMRQKQYTLDSLKIVNGIKDENGSSGQIR